jgi:hypothetical protein
MYTFTPPELTYLQNRIGYNNHILFWMEPRDYATNLRTGFGFWTGDEDATFTIDDGARLYQGAGAISSVDNFIMEAGLTIRNQRLTLNPLHPGVAQALRGYDAWRAPATIHRAMYDTISGALIATPHRRWKGFVHAAPINTAAAGGESSVEVSLTSAADVLAQGLTATRSDTSQQARGGDRGFRYKDAGGKYSWGAAS